MHEWDKIFGAAGIFIVLSSLSFAKSLSKEQDNRPEERIINAIQTVNSINKSKPLCETSNPIKTNSIDCDAINEYPRPSNVALAFAGGPESKLCSQYQLKRTNLNLCEKPESRYNEGHVALSRDQMENQGVESILNSKKSDPENQRKEIFSLAEYARHQVAVSCCKSDVTCYRSMLDIKISMCEPPEDASSPDHCSDGVHYDLPIGEVYEIFGKIHETYSDPNNNLQDTDVKKIKDRIDPLFSSFIAKTAINWMRSNSFFPVSGEVVLSPYSGQANSISNLNHEFNHACDSIKAQQMAINGKNEPKKAFWATERLTSSFLSGPNRCEYSDEKKEYFRTLWMDLGENKELALCLEKGIETMSEPGKDRYCKKVCKGIQLLESFAVAREIGSFDQRSLTSIYPLKACFGALDEEHPMHIDVLECLAQYSPKFNKQFKRAFNCEGSN